MRNDFESNYLMHHDFLMHHGIYGQKWGIRRYQNPDGSLTEAGRKRYGVGPGKGVDDINSEKGTKRRIKDVKKSIAKNNKARGKEYSKIANNPENFLGLNKKHGKKIEEYSENIKKGEEEIKRLKIVQDDKKLKDKSSELSPREEVIDKTISVNKSRIASDVAKGMISDLKRWESEGSTQMPSQLKGKSDAEMEKIIESKISEQISNYHKDTMYEFSDGKFDFVIDGIEEYSDSAPITVEYDVKKKKADFHYT